MNRRDLQLKLPEEKGSVREVGPNPTDHTKYYHDNSQLMHHYL